MIPQQKIVELCLVWSVQKGQTEFVVVKKISKGMLQEEMQRSEYSDLLWRLGMPILRDTTPGNWRIYLPLPGKVGMYRYPGGDIQFYMERVYSEKGILAYFHNKKEHKGDELILFPRVINQWFPAK